MILPLARCIAMGADATPPNTITTDEKLAGWTLLFDGRTMNGWDDPGAKTPAGDAWTIEDSCLRANAHPRIVEDLFTKASYTDFELGFDWRISPQGNSGLKYRIQDHLFVFPMRPGESFEQSVERSFLNRVSGRPARGQDYVIGFEYQILDSPAQIDPRQTTGALYEMVAPSGQPARPVGEFNHSRIVLRGNRVEHWLNGVKVVDTTLDSPEALRGIEKRWDVAPHVYGMLAKQPSKSCPISLQNHGDAAWFRNLKIRTMR